jgi:thiamine-phosphate pyrophosphorylase
MIHQFTAAAERVLQHAAGWIDRDSLCQIDSRTLLLGLLVEDECRAAKLLILNNVVIEDVCERWGVSEVLRRQPGINNPPYHFTDDVNRAIRQVHRFVLDFEQNPILATEHLLLVILYCDDEISHWLAERGISHQTLENDLRARCGATDVPIDLGDVLENEEIEKGEGESGKEEFLDEAIGMKVRSATETSSASDASPVFRILDAAANRAREGFRVIEDFLRFVLDDRFLTETAKQLRHDFVAEIKKIPAALLLASRETQADVGTGLTTAAESRRKNLSDVLSANFGRLQESLRSLEEYGKLIDPAMAAEMKQIRYRIYTLERAVEIARQSGERLAAARLYVLIDGRDSLDEFRRFASSLISAGVHVLQLRDKNLDDRSLLERAHALRELTRNTPTIFIMNDRSDLALLSRADGVHLGQEELSVKDARTILGPAALIGVSTHDIAQARQAVLDGANYLGVGPTFPSTTKSFSSFPGLDFATQVATEIRLPAFAIGGITQENISQVLATGIGRVAVSGAITLAANPECVAREFLLKI